MAYSAELWGLVVLLLAVAAFSALLLLYARSRIRKRRRELSEDIASSETHAEERAFNRIKMDESEIQVLEREGIDVAPAKAKLAAAQRAFDRRDFFSAYQDAKACHDGLVAARRDPSPIAPSLPLGTDPLDGGRTADPGAPGDAAPPPPPAPRNRMESHFQLSLLTDELAAAVRANPGSPSLAGVQQMATEARAQAEREEYTDALGTALKARRLLGGKVESVPPPSRRTEAAAASGSPSGGSPAGACPRCGRPMRANDAFCRGCGTPRSASRCVRCGQTLEAGDQFCAACGAAQGSTSGPTPSA